MLEILYISPPVVKSLSEGISSTARLPQVVSFGHTVHDRDYVELTSHDIATLVGSGEGWKVIRFSQTALFGPEALEALLKKHNDSVKVIKLMKMEENTLSTVLGFPFYLRDCKSVYTMILQSKAYRLGKEEKKENRSDRATRYVWSLLMSLLRSASRSELQAEAHEARP